MPRENRKRGKKHKKPAEEEWQPPKPAPVHEFLPSAEPSWVIQDPDQLQLEQDSPFGVIDADVKAYFRTVDVQLREWQSEDVDKGLDEGEGEDPSEGRRLFFTAAMEEMSGKETQLATDPECSIVLERMIYSMDDFARRVLADRFSGSFDKLIKHRFASHVCQTLFAQAGHTVARELRSGSKPVKSDDGELRTMSRLIPDICEELLDDFTSFLHDHYASHVIRALFILLVPSIPQEGTAKDATRSKRSAKWKSRQGPLKSVFTSEKGKEKVTEALPVPEEFSTWARTLLDTLKKRWNENEIRAMATDVRACPLLKVLLEAEAELGITDATGSLFDSVTEGSLSYDGESEPPFSHFLATLLRDTTSSHLMETLLNIAPPAAFNLMWSTYIRGQLSRLADHPVANFVVAKGFEKLDESQLKNAFEELQGGWSRIVAGSRIGVLKALILRSGALRCCEDEANTAVLSAFGIQEESDGPRIIQCALRQLSLSELQNVDLSLPTDRDQATNPRTEPKVQGALLLQSLLRLPQPSNQLYIDSILAMSPEEIISLAHSPISSRVLDALLDSETVPLKSKRKFVVSLIGHFHVLVDDRIGSRVGDRCWAFADTYLKEKIARSLFPHEAALSASFYGKFFARGLSLYLLKRKPDEWKEMQKNRSQGIRTNSAAGSNSAVPLYGSNATSAPPAASPAAVAKPEKKRKERPEDEIDAVFKRSSGKKAKRSGALDAPPLVVQEVPVVARQPKKPASDLDAIFKAIRSAPNEGKKKKT